MVGLEPFTPGSHSLFGKTEQNAIGLPEVHLIWREAIECRVRHHFVVLLNVEGHQTPDGHYRVELVEIEPLMLEGTPPSFDERVGEGDVYLGEHTPELVRIEEAIPAALRSILNLSPRTFALFLSPDFGH